MLGLFDGGGVVNRYRYAPSGTAERVEETVANPLRFTARYRDAETGLYHYRARYYDPDLARFISEDPIGLAGGINPFAYVGNSPVNARDPFGWDDTDYICIAYTTDNGYGVTCIKVRTTEFKSYSSVGVGSPISHPDDLFPHGVPWTPQQGAPQRADGPSCGAAVISFGLTAGLDVISSIGFFKAGHAAFQGG